MACAPSPQACSPEGSQGVQHHHGSWLLFGSQGTWSLQDPQAHFVGQVAKGAGVQGWALVQHHHEWAPGQGIEDLEGQERQSESVLCLNSGTRYMGNKIGNNFTAVLTIFKLERTRPFDNGKRWLRSMHPIQYIPRTGAQWGHLLVCHIPWMPSNGPYSLTFCQRGSTLGPRRRGLCAVPPWGLRSRGSSRLRGS